MSISTATFSQWYTALEFVFIFNNAGITIEKIDKDKLRTEYYDKNFTPHNAMKEIITNELNSRREKHAA